MKGKITSSDIVLINPFALKGGASIGTFKLFKYLNDLVSRRSFLLVVNKSSADHPLILGQSNLYKTILYLQGALNKLLCIFCSKGELPVIFTFFSIFSIPALFLYFKAKVSKHVYLHSMNSGFACPISFSLLLNISTIIKTADDWYLTGGCHYALNCNQWKTGCKACPHMNFLGKKIVRINWVIKNSMLSKFSGYIVSPSRWLSNRCKIRFGQKCRVIYNAASNLSDISNVTSESTFIFSKFSSENPLVLGLPVSSLNDYRKGFSAALPVLQACLSCFPIHLILCGKDSYDYSELLHDSKSCHFHGSHIFAIGELNPDNMTIFYSKLNFLLHFAEYDNSPNTITEAFGCGIPCIVLDKAGSPEHIKNSNGGYILSQPDDLLKIISLIFNQPELAFVAKKNAIAYGREHLSPKAMANSYSSLFSFI
ncbi:glycosyltransferase [bacterium]|nr:glycosyltransferase [bacterium]